MPQIQDVGKFLCNSIFAKPYIFTYICMCILVYVCRCLDMFAYNDMNTETKMGGYLNEK